MAGGLARWFLFTGTVLAVGAACFRFLVLPRTGSSPEASSFREHALRRSADLGLLGGLLTLPALLGVLVVQVAEFRDPYGPLGPQVELLLTGTPWGRVWIVHLGVGVAATLFFLAARKPASTGWWISAAGAAAALGVLPAFSGHSFGAERLTPLAVTADAVHVLAAGAWIGSLAVLVPVGLFLPDGTRSRPEVVRSLVRAFSPLALASASVLALTGGFAAWLHGGGDPGVLLESTWGRLLALKLLLVGCVWAFGWYNWRRATPRLDREEGVRSFLHGSARGELLTALAVLLVTAVLVWTSPPG